MKKIVWSRKKSFSWLIIFIVCFIVSLFIVFFKDSKVNVSEKKKIVATTFASYDWVYHIVGENSESIVYYMTEKNGIDYHFFNPTESDLQQIADCDLLICNGYEDGIWAEKAAKASGKNIRIVNLKRLLAEQNSLKEMGEKQSTFENMDEHVWLSVKNAVFFVDEIENAIEELDPENKSVYSKNEKNYLNQLDSLDAEYSDFFGSAKNYIIILADKNPFTYIFNDYNVNYVSALDSCGALRFEDNKNNGPASVDKFVSEEKIAYLTSKMDEYNVTKVYKLDDSSDKLPHYVIRDSENKLSDILILDSMHKATLNETFKGKSFVKTMRNNLNELKKSVSFDLQ